MVWVTFSKFNDGVCSLFFGADSNEYFICLKRNPDYLIVTTPNKTCQKICIHERVFHTSRSPGLMYCLMVLFFFLVFRYFHFEVVSFRRLMNSKILLLSSSSLLWFIIRIICKHAVINGKFWKNEFAIKFSNVLFPAKFGYEMPSMNGTQ